jgi:DNA-3-methyladenine glycosylase II
MSTKVHQRFLKVASGVSQQLTAAIERTGPVQLKRARDTTLAEALCSAVAGQQLSTKAASTIWGRVLESADGKSLIDHFHQAKPAALRKCGLSGAKSKTMQSIAAATLSGELDETALKQLDHAERAIRLTAIWGVGDWTADMMSIFYFGDRDVWPDGDLAAARTLENLTSRRRKTALTAERFAPHRSYLALYMWRHADAAPV